MHNDDSVQSAGLHEPYGLPLGTDGKFAGLFSRSRFRLAISAFRSLSSRI